MTKKVHSATMPVDAWAALSVGALLAVASVAFVRLELATDVAANATTFVYEFHNTKWALLTVVGVVWAAVLAGGLLRGRSSVGFGLVELCLGALILLAMISITWAPDRAAALLSTLHIATLVMFAFLARLTAKGSMDYISAAYAAVGIVALLGIPLLGDTRSIDNGFGNENFASEFALGATGLALVGAFGTVGIVRLLSIAAASLGVFYLVVAAPSNLQFLGVAAAIYYLLVVSLKEGYRWKVASLLAAAAVALVLAAAAFAPLERLPLSFLDRFQGWVNAARMIIDMPVTGTGLGGFFFEIPSYIDSYYLVFPALGEPAYSNYARIPSSVENDALQVIAELGLGGALLAALFLFAVVGAGLRSESWSGRFYWMTLFALLGASLVSFPLQNPSSGTVFAILVGAAIGRPAAAAESWLPRRQRLLAAGLVIALAGLSVPHVMETKAHILLSESVALNDLGKPSLAADTIRNAVEVSGLAPRIRSQLFPQVVVAGPTYWRDGIAEGEMERIYRKSSSAAPHNSLLVDLRVRYLLSHPLGDEQIAEIVRLIEGLKKRTGRTSPAPHILEAALAIQLSDIDAASRALDAAEPLLPVNDLADSNGHLANYTALRATVARSRGQ